MAGFNEDGTLLQVDDHPVRKAALTGKHVNQQLVGVKLPSGGELIWMLISAEPILKDSGYIDKIICTYHDITEHRRIEEQVKLGQKTFSELVERAPFGIYVIDSQFCIAHMNAGSQNGAFRNVKPVIGRDFTEAMHIMWPDDVAEGIISAFRNTLETGEPFYSPRFTNPRNDAEIVESYEWELHRILLPDGQYGVICYYFDSTELRNAEANVIQTKEQFLSVLENSRDFIYRSNLQTANFEYVSPSVKDVLGYTPEEFISMDTLTTMEMVHPDDKSAVLEAMNKLEDTGSGVLDYRLKSKEGNYHWVSNHLSVIKDNSGLPLYRDGNVRDITAYKNSEEALRKNQAKLEMAFTSMTEAIFIADAEGRLTDFNDEFIRYHRFRDKEQCSKTITECPVYLDAYFPDGTPAPVEMWAMPRALQGETGSNIEYMLKRKDTGETWWGSYNFGPIRDEKGSIIGAIVSAREITELKKAEHALKESGEKLELALITGNIGLWEWNLQTGEVIWDERMEAMFGLEQGTFGKTYKAFENLLNEEDISHIQKAIDNSLVKDLPLETILRTKAVNGETKYLSAKAIVNKDKDGKPESFTGVCFDLTGMKLGTEKLGSKLNEELLRSNKELEQFAYVASHDLQEPLRMVSNFTQMLAQRYEDQLDQDARDYIQFVVNGAKRMSDLIYGLLTYSRINSKGISFISVNMNDVLQEVITNLNLVLNEKNAKITWDELPSVYYDESQMIQLMQNLVGNAAKFSGNNKRIHIGVKLDAEQYIFSVKDEGIGIEPQYFDRIFQIFQRLHPKEEYEGTGIGLAVCRRIVERHDGKIWLESSVGKGTTFYFTIPKINKNK